MQNLFIWIWQTLKIMIWHELPELPKPDTEEDKVTIDLVKAEVKRLKSIAEKRLENMPPIEHPETVDDEYLIHITRVREAKMDGLGGQVEAYTNVLSFLDTLNEPIVMHTPRYAPPEPQEPKVDLENEIKLYLAQLGFGDGDGWADGITINDLRDIARHFYALGKQAQEPSLPSDLDEAAETYSQTLFCSNLKPHNDTGICDDCGNVRLAFKAGAEWMAEAACKYGMGEGQPGTSHGERNP